MSPLPARSDRSPRSTAQPEGRAATGAPPELITDPAAWTEALEERRRRVIDEQRRSGRSATPAGGIVGLVPTMGALHAGHLSLIRRAGADCAVVAVTIYVNPLQFAPTDDLSAYPRDLERDLELAAEAGADVVFAPTPEAMWPDPPVTSVHVAGVTERLEGASRPGHFDGVATIVAKLFAQAGPCWAYFGEKDFQQLTMIRRMATDLSLPVAVVGCPTVRDADGLALSSRNAYLDSQERAVAPKLYYALLAGKRAVEDDGVTDTDRVCAAMVASLAEEPRFELDYADVADPVDFHRPARLSGEARLLIAARLGRARLIDNLPVNPPLPAETDLP